MSEEKSRPNATPDGFPNGLTPSPALDSTRTTDEITSPGVATPEQEDALKIARTLIEAGVPVFVAWPDSTKGPGNYQLPRAWEQTRPNVSVLERWRPGCGLAAVGGHVADVLDVDPRNGGEASARELRAAGHWPRSFGRQATPSGGTHDVISATGERKCTDLLPGVDLQSGAARPDVHGKHGRGFVWIAPTVRRSKATGELMAYRWIEEPDMEALAEFSGTDDSLDGLVARVHARRARKSTTPALAGAADPFVAASLAGTGAQRTFTPEQAREFCTPALQRLQQARIGEIEERCNAAAAQLYHFVPAFWDVETAYAVLTDALSLTAYDPAHRASTWRAEKFRAVLDGTRPPADGWKAQRVEQSAKAPAGAPEGPKPDAVEALMAKLLDRDALETLPPVRPLVAGLLDMDSESWIIGEPGGFKSFVALDIACHVATGRAWRDRKVTQGPVVYIVAEGSKSIRKRVQAWEKTYGARATGVYFLPQPVQAADRPAWGALVEVVRRVQPALVVIDTQARCTVGLKENDNSEMGVFIDAVGAAKRAAGACVLVVHHTGRDGENARGASALDGAQDTELKVIRPAARAARAELTAEIRQDKQKDGDDSEVIKIKLHEVVVGTNEFTGQPLTSLALLPSDPFAEASGGAPDIPNWQRDLPANQQEIMQVMHDHGASEIGLTHTEVLNYVNERRKERSPDAPRMAKSSRATAVNVLVGKGLLARDGKMRVLLPEYSGQE